MLELTLAFLSQDLFQVQHILSNPKRVYAASKTIKIYNNNIYIYMINKFRLIIMTINITTYIIGIPIFTYIRITITVFTSYFVFSARAKSR